MSVGSGTGAPTLGTGGCSTAFAVALSPAAIISFYPNRLIRLSVRETAKPLNRGSIDAAEINVSVSNGSDATQHFDGLSWRATSRFPVDCSLKARCIPCHDGVGDQCESPRGGD
jgi:hypothetical protein